MYEELGLAQDKGAERFICSLEGSRTSSRQCNMRYGQNGRWGTGCWLHS